MDSKMGLGLRKGAWTAEEDMLLKNCIKKYGEGKWHLVPLKAGLNRCRKSCRLRWLNYLRPNIKRGEFGQDEVDLIMRLHKLLGNRWSLIAGRIPGRTANDVKNYWNTHLHKNTKDKQQKLNHQKITTTNVLKPRAHTLNNNLHWLSGNYNSREDNTRSCRVDSLNNSTWSPSILGDGVDEWWDDLVGEYKTVDDGQVEWSFGGSMAAAEKEGSLNGWCDISIGEDLWDDGWTFNQPSTSDH